MRESTGAPQPSDADDAMLMAEVSRHDRQAFTLLIDRHLAPLRGFLYRLSGNAADAEEIAQEAFLRVWKESYRWQRDRVKFTTWLYSIARNLAIDSFRRRRGEAAGDAVEPIDESAPPDRHMEAERLRLRVQRAVSGLPERQRSALTLCHYQGLSNADAAAVLGVGIEAVESLLARARRTLKQTLATEIDRQMRGTEHHE